MPFKPVIHKIKREPKEISKVLEEANEIYEFERLPKGLDGCKDCEMLNNLINMVDA